MRRPTNVLPPRMRVFMPANSIGHFVSQPARFAVASCHDRSRPPDAHGRVPAPPDRGHVRLGRQRLGALERRLLLHPRRRGHRSHALRRPPPVPEHRRHGRVRLHHRRRPAAQPALVAAPAAAHRRHRRRPAEPRDPRAPSRAAPPVRAEPLRHLLRPRRGTACTSPTSRTASSATPAGARSTTAPTSTSAARSPARSPSTDRTLRSPRRRGSACATTPGAWAARVAPPRPPSPPTPARDPRRGFAMRQWTMVRMPDRVMFWQFHLQADGSFEPLETVVIPLRSRAQRPGPTWRPPPRRPASTAYPRAASTACRSPAPTAPSTGSSSPRWAAPPTCRAAATTTASPIASAAGSTAATTTVRARCGTSPTLSTSATRSGWFRQRPDAWAENFATCVNLDDPADRGFGHLECVLAP